MFPMVCCCLLLCRHTAQFASVKPGPAVSAFMAQQGIQPAPDLLQAHAGELTRITLPAQLLHKQQQQADAVATAVANTSQQADPYPYSFNSVGSDTAVPDGHQAKAAACLAAATDAVEAYERRKAATAASVKAGNLSAQMQVQMLCRQRARAIAAGPTKAKAVSNKVSGESNTHRLAPHRIAGRGKCTEACCLSIRGF